MKSGKASRLLRIITIPIRALGKARDLYVRGMTMADRRGYGSGLGGGAAGALPKSFSARPSRARGSDDYAELIRAASARAYGSAGIDVEAILRQQLAEKSAATAAAAAAAAAEGNARLLAKCSSVGMGKIDEDKPCDFDGDHFAANKPGLLYPRSRSYAVAKRSVAVF